MRIPFPSTWTWSCLCINITWSQTVLSVPSSGLQRFRDTALETAMVMVRSQAQSCTRMYPWRLKSPFPIHSKTIGKLQRSASYSHSITLIFFQYSFYPLHIYYLIHKDGIWWINNTLGGSTIFIQYS